MRYAKPARRPMQDKTMTTITPYLWFNDDLEAAVDFYKSIFPEAKVGNLMRNPDSSGTLFTADFELAGQKFMGLNGGPHFKFTEAISLFVSCADQAEVDHFWSRLTADGGQESQCGWLKDKFGLSWQIIPKQLMQTIGGSDRAGAKRALDAMMQMRKIDVATLEKAYAG